MTLRIVVAEDNYLVREGLVRLLSDGEDIEVLEAVSDAPSLLAASENPEVQAVLTDIRMPPNHSTDGIEAAHTIRKGGLRSESLSSHSMSPAPTRSTCSSTGRRVWRIC